MAYTNSEKRSEFIDNWYKLEKSAERIAGVILLFAVGLIVAFDKPGDQWTALAVAGMLSAAITIFVYSRKPRAIRTNLHFMKEQTQSQRSVIAGMGAMVLITQLGGRPLAVIIGGLLLIVAVWFQWRAYQIREFDRILEEKADKTDETNNDVTDED